MRPGRRQLLAGLGLFVLTAGVDTALGVDVTWMAPLLPPEARAAHAVTFDPVHDSAAARYGTPVAGGSERVLLLSSDGVLTPHEDPSLRLMALPAPDARPWPARRLWLFGGGAAALLLLVGLVRARSTGGGVSSASAVPRNP